jgi:hyperosmotically inducible protein
MKPLQLFGAAASVVLALAGCQRGTQADVKQSARETAADIRNQTRQAASKATADLADGWLTTKIKSKYVADQDLKASDIDVSSHDGVVTLSGKVLNDPMRTLAMTIAQHTDGVKQVVNNLSVTLAAPVANQAQTSAAPSASGEPSGAVATSGTVATSGAAGDTDSRITATIQSKYFLDDKIKGRPINVQSSNGVVTLNGDVRDEIERGEALLLARTTPGVRRVEDDLTVTGDASDVATRLGSAGREDGNRGDGEERRRVASRKPGECRRETARVVAGAIDRRRHAGRRSVARRQDCTIDVRSLLARSQSVPLAGSGVAGGDQSHSRGVRRDAVLARDRVGGA